MKYIKYILGILCFILLSLGLVGCFYRNKKVEVINTSIDPLYYEFQMNGEVYKIGSLVSDLEKRGFNYKDEYYSDENKLVNDAITTYLFKKDDKDMFYGVMHCENEDGCEYSNTNIIKLNFYKDSNVILNHSIAYDSSCDDIVSFLGTEDGKFYMDDSLKVWSISKNGEVMILIMIGD